jgi:hypothetical protein
VQPVARQLFPLVDQADPAPVSIQGNCNATSHHLYLTGNIGYGRRLDFTLIGPDVNLVSRLQGICRLDVDVAQCRLLALGHKRPLSGRFLPAADQQIYTAARGQASKDADNEELLPPHSAASQFRQPTALSTAALSKRKALSVRVSALRHLSYDYERGRADAGAGSIPDI